MTRRNIIWIISETSNALFLGEIIPFPKLIRSSFRITTVVKHFPEGELCFLAHEDHAPTNNEKAKINVL